MGWGRQIECRQLNVFIDALIGRLHPPRERGEAMPLLVQNACLDQPLFPEAQSRAGAVFARPLCDTILI